MHVERTSVHGMWSSKLVFVLAATGSAVGLGNIWRFPYITAENGGGAFVLVYLACIALLGLPIMISEILLGRRGRMSPINSMRELAREVGASQLWQGIGWLGLVAGLLILSFYSVVAGWTIHYLWLYVEGLFTATTAVGDPGTTFSGLLESPWRMLGLHTLFMLMTLGVVSLGVEKGLERAVRYLMPALFLILLFLVGYGMFTGHFGEAVAFMFKPDFGRLTGSSIIQAMGQAFFTLSLGMGAIMAYGAYLPDDASVGKTGLAVALADTGVALVAGLAIFPIVFKFALDAGDGGPGLIFLALPNAFADMGTFGAIYAILFFGLLTVAAWTSSISLLEPAVAYFVESTPLGRKGAALLIGGTAWFLGIASALGYNLWSHVRWGERDILDSINHIASDIMLPIGGFLIAIFAGWILTRADSRDEMPAISETAFNAWRILARYVTPVLVLVVLVAAL